MVTHSNTAEPSEASYCLREEAFVKVLSHGDSTLAQQPQIAQQRQDRLVDVALVRRVEEDHIETLTPVSTGP